MLVLNLLSPRVYVCVCVLCPRVCVHVLCLKNLVQNSVPWEGVTHTEWGVPSSANLQNLFHRQIQVCSLSDLSPVRLSITIPCLFNLTPKSYITLNQTFHL